MYRYPLDLPFQLDYRPMNFKTPTRVQEEVEETSPIGAPVKPLSPIDYKRGPFRASLVQAAQVIDKEYGAEGYALVNAAAQLLRAAMNGEKSALAMLADRFDGKPAQAVQVTGEDGGPVQFTNVSRIEVARRIAFLLSQGVDLLKEQQKVIEHG